MILDRRGFLGGLPALVPAAAMAAEEPSRTRFYVLEQYYLEQGSQPARLHEFLSKALLPAMNKAAKRPMIFLEALLAPHLPQVAMIFGLSSLAEAAVISQALDQDSDFRTAFDAWEAPGAPYLSRRTTLLAATDFSPELAVPEKPPASPRVFELRVYHSSTERQLKLLLQRFSGAEIKIFHRSGVHPAFYTTTVIGDLRPNLTYLIPFDSLAAREKAWAAFSADEEWVRVRQESIERGGQLTPAQQISMFKATPYSPVR